MSEKDINNLKEMLVDFNEYSTDYTKTRCRELEETIENTLKEIERLNNIINELLKRQNEALNYISNFLSMDNRYKHGNGNDELELVRRILNKHNQEPKGSDKE